ncbi:hypothetical protein ZWY2020_014161 [Hordeum vulgare]|nr:hypothetical protein ZWY2020_014161 [Hordeum vulgare]
MWSAAVFSDCDDVVPLALQRDAMCYRLDSYGLGSGSRQRGWGSFVDAFLFRIKKNRESLMSRKIWSRRYSISQEFVDCSVLNYNGKTHVRCKITEGKVGHKFGEFYIGQI